MNLKISLNLRVVIIAFCYAGATAAVASPSYITGDSPEGQIILAQNAGKKKKAKKDDSKDGGAKERKRTLVGEKKYQVKKGERTNLDFEAADISGARKTPLGSIVDSVQSDKDYDFVKVRLRWTPEMVQSASSLETGSSAK